MTALWHSIYDLICFVLVLSCLIWKMCQSPRYRWCKTFQRSMVTSSNIAGNNDTYNQFITFPFVLFITLNTEFSSVFRRGGKSKEVVLNITFCKYLVEFRLLPFCLHLYIWSRTTEIHCASYKSCQSFASWSFINKLFLPDSYIFLKQKNFLHGQ